MVPSLPPRQGSLPLCEPGIHCMASQGRTLKWNGHLTQWLRTSGISLHCYGLHFRGDEVARPHSKVVAEPGTEPRQSGSRAQYLTTPHPLPNQASPAITSLRETGALSPVPSMYLPFTPLSVMRFRSFSKLQDAFSSVGSSVGRQNPRFYCYCLIGFPSLRNYNTHRATRQGHAWLRDYFPVAFWEL